MYWAIEMLSLVATLFTFWFAFNKIHLPINFNLFGNTARLIKFTLIINCCFFMNDFDLFQIFGPNFSVRAKMTSIKWRLESILCIYCIFFFKSYDFHFYFDTVQAYTLIDILGCFAIESGLI